MNVETAKARSDNGGSTCDIFSQQERTDMWVSKHWIADWLSRGATVYFVEPIRGFFLPGRGGRVRELFAGPRIVKHGAVHVVIYFTYFLLQAPGHTSGTVVSAAAYAIS